ncbi:hypothetical protein M3P05_14585, partial [Sansalvadorimonas sp. 2012CJ34-2]
QQFPLNNEFPVIAGSAEHRIIGQVVNFQLCFVLPVPSANEFYWLIIVPRSSQNVLADNLIKAVSQYVATIPDTRPNQCDSKITLHDAIMFALAVMHLKYPSLLAFERDKPKEEIAHNLETLYHINKVPCDTYMRELLTLKSQIFSLFVLSNSLASVF